MKQGESKHVMNLWRLTLRSLGICASQRKPFVWHVATNSYNELEAVRKARQRFTADWWADKIITDIESVGRLHVIEDVSLYEEDD